MSYDLKSVMSTGRIIASALLVLTTVQVGDAAAQTTAPSPAPAAPRGPNAGQIAIPDSTKITLLIQLHMAALSLSNLTGNYSVLHALGSPSFQAMHSQAQLAASFAGFRAQSIDVSPTILYPPVLFSAPRLEPGNIIRVSGQYETLPQRVMFDLAFQAVNDAWRLAAISVKTVSVPPPRVADSEPKIVPNDAAPKTGARPSVPAKK